MYDKELEKFNQCVEDIKEHSIKAIKKGYEQDLLLIFQCLSKPSKDEEDATELKVLTQGYLENSTPNTMCEVFAETISTIFDNDADKMARFCAELINKINERHNKFIREARKNFFNCKFEN